ncbi:penicillin acylase family protein [Ornithinibacillus scapharcae]|uniref:penicillin acylase family protein n=1 Tax=Ornithinibacillus scapharcae TaxID=1147159 RepID=UPI000225B871|nr:penicillin acylase family protein [Ornithinibacillus scapharcae]
MSEPSLAENLSEKKLQNWKKIIFLIVGVLLAILLIGVFFVNAYINKSLPQVEGTIEIPGLQDEVIVTTDEHGVPHIQASNDHDLYMAQGYMQAQNRIFQMELSRRQASGTLSEVVGESTINQDKYFRTLGLRRAAEKSYQIYSDESKQILQWFADGVNTYINQAKESNSLPIEFTLIGSEPAEWTPIDSLTIGKFMAFDLGGHWERQAFNYYVLNEFNEEKAYELFPVYPETKPTIIQEDEIVDVASSFEKAVIPHPFNGSNNWVVSGEKTQSGMPLLADDPHLGLATPSIWMQMHLQTDELNVSGVIFAGVPGIILGHNDYIAWGVTNTGPDVQQLYLEKQNPDNPNEYLFDEEWEEATIIEEPIKVKDGETIDYQVVETRHGPIVSEFAENSGKNTVMSLRWTALDATTELEAILEMNQAKNWKEFEKGLEKFLVPAQNFVFASKDGTIAYKANGKIPIYENSEDALIPLPGWDPTYILNEYIPFDELPKVVNPKKGYIATANNKVAGNEYPYHISNVWAQPYRYERIAEVLEANDTLTKEDMMALQMDQTNLQAREFVPMFLDMLKDSKLSKYEAQALSLLTEWDYVDNVDAVQPLIFHHWINSIEDILYNELPDGVMDLFNSRGQTTDELLRKAASGEGSIWVDENGGLESVLHVSLQQTIEKLTESYGEDMDTWKWGDYHQVQFHHPLSAVHPVLAYFFNNGDPVPVGGSNVTPMAAAFETETGEVDHGASWRFVIDMEDPTTGYHIVGPGQEGHFRSDWYHNQIDDWVEGIYHETKLIPENGKVLHLVP